MAKAILVLTRLWEVLQFFIQTKQAFKAWKVSKEEGEDEPYEY
jgi:hypothetical protein